MKNCLVKKRQGCWSCRSTAICRIYQLLKMKGAYIKLRALNNKRIEILERWTPFYLCSSPLHLLWSFQLFFNANIYTIKGHPYEMQSPALGPRLFYERFSQIGQKCGIRCFVNWCIIFLVPMIHQTSLSEWTFLPCNLNWRILKSSWIFSQLIRSLFSVNIGRNLPKNANCADGFSTEQVQAH